MKKFFLFVLWLCLTSWLISCNNTPTEPQNTTDNPTTQDSTTNTTTNAPDEPLEKVSSLLWKIEGDNIQTSYVFGTMHVMPKKDFKLDSRVTDALKSSQTLALEIDEKNMDVPPEQLMGMMKMKNGQTLDKLLSKEEYEKLDKAFKKIMNGLGLEYFNEILPAFVSVTLIMPMMGNDIASYEDELSAIATDNTMPIVGLETVGDQLKLFEDIPMETQLEWLRESVLEADKTKQMLDSMITFYKTEDIEGLYTYTEKYFESETLIAPMLWNRNKKWIPLIQEMAGSKSVFVGVGAGHLGGPQGVLKLLEAEGLKVTPVME